MTVRPAVALVERGHILLMQYRYGETDVYNLPGGNPDPNETLTQTVERELEEELGVTVEVGKMILTGEVLRPEAKKDVLHCVFGGEIISGIPEINPEQTSAKAIVWMPLSQLHTLAMYPQVGEELQAFFRNELDSPYIGKIKQQWY
jgi:8-oxo-dGTP diphosphatase